MTGAPTRIGRYTVAQELGSGGMGEVFLAYSPAGDPVAVKLIRADRLDPETRRRFEKEALIARTVVGTNRVARFLDADPYAERPWMAMEYVPGRTLQNYVDGDGPLSAPLVASLGALLAEGLGAVHAAGLLHRDLKPQNIIMGEYGPAVIDFGLAAFSDKGKGTLSHSGMIIGTVRCMPPEQASGHPQVTEAADVYALGTVLLYAATAHYPYEGNRWQVIAAQVTNPEHGPDLSGLPEVLAPMVSSMLAFQAADRPTMDAVAEACTRLLAELRLLPTQARRALIELTAQRDSDARAASSSQVPSSSIEDFLWTQSSESTGSSLDSPLDGPPGAMGSTTEAAEDPTRAQTTLVGEPDEEPPAAEAAEPDTAAARRPRSRVPAGLRVSDELRLAYAQQAAL